MASEESGEAIDARARLIEWALGEVGPQDPNKYYRICAPQFADKGAEHSVSWCGIFYLAGLVENGLCAWQWSTRRSEPGIAWRLRKVAFPDVGDLVIFQKGADHTRDLWHHAFVRRPPANGLVDTVDGNVLIAPAEGVATRTRSILPTQEVTFYSIAGLLADRAGATVKA